MTPRMTDDPARIEEALLEPGNTSMLVQCFVDAKGVSFENILDP